MDKQVTVFAALSDPLRLRSLALMDSFGEACVCQLSHALEAPQSKLSKHLAVLRAAGLVVPHRAAQWVLYRLAPLTAWEHDALRAAIASLAAEPMHRSDRRRFATAPDGPPVSRLKPQPAFEEHAP